MKKEAKEIAFPGGEESVERVVVFPNHEMGQDSDFFVGLR
jgi:hypothetical protein